MYEIMKNRKEIESALEISGPSELWEETIPVYGRIKNIDFVNRYEKTINHYGRNYIASPAEVTALRIDKKYDVVLLSHVLEHIANPIKALVEIYKILKPGGDLAIITPNKEYMFDKQRKITTFRHILDDFIFDTSEGDLTHLDEIVETFDFSFTFNQHFSTKEQIRKEGHDNFKLRHMHHHVFDIPLISRMADLVGFAVTDALEFVSPLNTVTVLHKPE